MNELRMTKDDPRQVTPITQRRDPIINTFGTMAMNSMELIAPVYPNPTRNFFR
jgi:hypothetical protein